MKRLTYGFGLGAFSLFSYKALTNTVRLTDGKPSASKIAQIPPPALKKDESGNYILLDCDSESLKMNSTFISKLLAGFTLTSGATIWLARKRPVARYLTIGLNIIL